MAKKRDKHVTKAPRVSVGLPPDELRRLVEIATTHERSVAWLIRHAVKLFLSEMEKGQLSLELEPRVK
jgi:hypothetical protein